MGSNLARAAAAAAGSKHDHARPRTVGRTAPRPKRLCADADRRAACLCTGTPRRPGELMLFYSGSDSRDGGLSDLVVWRDGAGGFSELGSIALQSPSWVLPHPRLPLLYATQESEPGEVVVI